jgi:hypothetical protein
MHAISRATLWLQGRFMAAPTGANTVANGKLSVVCSAYCLPGSLRTCIWSVWKTKRYNSFNAWTLEPEVGTDLPRRKLHCGTASWDLPSIPFNDDSLNGTLRCQGGESFEKNCLRDMCVEVLNAEHVVWLTLLPTLVPPIPAPSIVASIAPMPIVSLAIVTAHI